MTDHTPKLDELNDRSREVFRRVVEGYLETGDPVGSRSLTRTLSEQVSAATVRNVMQDLEYLGLLDSPHVSAGRVPTQQGLRMFVDGLLEVGDLAGDDRAMIDSSVHNNASDVTSLLDRMGSALSGVTHGASLVLTPKHEAPIRHIEFVWLAPDRALVVLVFGDGHVENRVFTPPPGQTPSSLREAANFLNVILRANKNAHTVAFFGQLKEIGDVPLTLQIIKQRTNTVKVRLVGIVIKQVAAATHDKTLMRVTLIHPRGQTIFHQICSQTINLLSAICNLGRDNTRGSSLVVSPYMNTDRKIIGAVGVIGPTRLNYGRIVPIVDYTAQLVGKLIADRS